ncbi:MAG: radical SAM family heme chaperone HemW [Desulfuromonadales bacterium]|nr:radical SAM family heme chaperone HemW [Desulfuromonadales bacterium]
MLGVYLHIPFCRRKCSYCDFFSVAAGHPAFTDYSDLLLRQLDIAEADGWQGPVDSVYFGGGTPSLLAAAEVERLLHAIDRRLGLTVDAEISLEANPGTVDLATLRALRVAGINRLSLGLQSLDNHQLRRLGRLHDRAAGLASVALARQAGFANLAVDLMFALPGQSLAQLDRQIDQYLALDVEHLSCYGLTAEEGTPLHRQVAAGKIELPDEELYRGAFLRIDRRLGTAGYRHYEIANYARLGFECRHNLRYWQRRPYLGLGAGAHSLRADGWGSRWAVAADLERYRRDLDAGRDPLESLERFDRQGALSETIYLGLRTATGISDADLRAGFGTDLATAFPGAVARLAPWLHQRNERWAFTSDGWLLFDRLIEPFLHGFPR